MKAEIGKKYTPTETIHHFGEDNFALFKDEESCYLLRTTTILPVIPQLLVT